MIPQWTSPQWNQKYTLATYVVVDFMSNMRQMPFGKCPTLSAVIDAITTSESCISHKSDCIHRVVDPYIEMSLMEGQRMGPSDPTTGINIIGMTRDTPIPQQLDKFWSSQEDRQMILLFIRDYVCYGHYVNTTIIASYVFSDDEVLPARADGGADIPELLNWAEEEDSRLVLHVEWAVRVKQYQRFVLLSNDTYTFAFLLHYAPYLQTLGLKVIWQQYGTGEKRRVLPLHHTVSELGASFVNTVFKAHVYY